MSGSSCTGTSAVDRLRALGYALGPVGEDPKYASYRIVDASIYVAGQLPHENGELLGEGTLGRDVDLGTGQALARQAAVNALAVPLTAVGGAGPDPRGSDAGVRGQHARLR